MNKLNKICFLMIFILVANSSVVYPFSAGEAYYKANKWGFIEDTLVDRVDHARPNVVMRVLLAACIGVFTGCITVGICAGKRLDQSFGGFLGSSVGITSFSLLLLFFFWNDYEIPIFENFLQNYDPDLNDSDSNNFKLYVPEVLHETFDILHEGYKQHGVEYLKGEGRRVLRRLMFDVKYKIHINI